MTIAGLALRSATLNTRSFSTTCRRMTPSLAVDTSRTIGAQAMAHDNQSSSSLPGSPTSILAGTKHGKPLPYTAPPIPRTFKESLNAWFKRTDSAAPELFLYRHTGYFTGATLNNAPNADLLTAFQAVKAAPVKAQDAKAQLQAALQGNLPSRATVATQAAPDGKVGSIRSVDIGSQISSGFSSWFGSGSTPRLINMLEVGTPRSAEEICADESEEKVVLLHGYGAGTGFFFQNIKALAGHANSRLYALDWLGMGRSSRVPFHISAKQSKTVETRVEAAESFFVQALEDWRAKMGVKKMTLIGHSLGGYLSIAYSLKYPQHVSRLVLLSPAGIPEAPEELKKDAKAAADQVAKEVQQPQDQVTPANAAQKQADVRKVRRTAATMKKGESVDDRIQSATRQDSDVDSVEDAPQPPRLGKRRRELIQFLWDANLSPFAILRSSLFMAPMLAGGYTSRRFASLPDEDLRTLHAYCYDIFTARGSSEYCLAHLLAPFGFARLPMVNRVAALPKTLPVTFIYGERGIDWMDEDGGHESVKRLAAAGNPHARCVSVVHAGHHVYLDNPKAFDALLSRVLRGKIDEGGKAGVAATS